MSRVTFSRCISQQTDHGRRRHDVCRNIRDLRVKSIFRQPKRDVGIRGLVESATQR